MEFDDSLLQPEDSIAPEEEKEEQEQRQHYRRLNCHTARCLYSFFPGGKQ